MTTAIHLLIPEIVLIAAAVAIYLGGAFSAARRAWNWIAGGAVLLSAAALWSQHGPASVCGPLILDSLAWSGRWLALGFGALFVMLSTPKGTVPFSPTRKSGQSLASRPLATDGTSERAGSLLLAVAGLMLVAGAGDLMLLFVGLELVSIPTYVLLYLGRRDEACQESAAKYFFLSVLASAILLYGFSFLYGATGSTELASIRAALDGTTPIPTGFATFTKLAMGLIFGGLCFKIAAVPFHFYAPDVYQGTTHANAALLSVVPKAAGFVALVRILVLAMPAAEPYSWRIVLAVSVLTMTFGNVMALWQDDLRRLLAYSSIAQSGYMLLALAAGMAARDCPNFRGHQSAAMVVENGTVPFVAASSAWDGIGALGFYFVAYALATLGAFAVFERLGRPDRSLDAVDELAGLGRTRPLAAAALAVFMFSLAGIPPLSGFLGKLLVFGGALNIDARAGAAGNMQEWFVVAAILGVLNSAVAAAYYLRIVAVMYFRTPLATPQAQGGAGAWWAATACALLLIGIWFYPGPLLREAGDGGRKQEAMPPPQSAPRPGVAATTTELLFRDLSCPGIADIIEYYRGRG